MSSDTGYWSVLWSRSRRLGLETYQRLVSRKTVNVSVSAIYVSCPRPIFGQIVQATLIVRVNFGRHRNASLLQLHQLVRSAFIHVESVRPVLTAIVTIAHHINTL